LNYSHKEFYSPSEKSSSLHDISIVIERGKRIALIGESGGGKSTLMALLRGLYCPRPGINVDVDGIEIQIESIANSITLFPQEPEIFESTIANNITLGLPVDDRDILQVCKTARFDEIVQQLPNGLDSKINEKGVNLSGGQKQRLALARGILAAKGSDIILMDEPASALDPIATARIEELILELKQQFTIVIVTHNMQQAARISDYTAFFYIGELIEYDRTAKVFTNPAKKQTEDYVTGRFG